MGRYFFSEQTLLLLRYDYCNQRNEYTIQTPIVTLTCDHAKDDTTNFPSWMNLDDLLQLTKSLIVQNQRYQIKECPYIISDEFQGGKQVQVRTACYEISMLDNPVTVSCHALFTHRYTYIYCFYASSISSEITTSIDFKLNALLI